MFIESVRAIYLEISAICNRNCVFCPNSDNLRMPKSLMQNRSTQTVSEEEPVFPATDYILITSKLGQAKYKNTFGFHLYNEPLFSVELFKSRLAIARSNMPLARLVLNTNGDFLDRSLLYDLSLLGLNHLHISLYAPNRGSDYAKATMSNLLKNKASSLGFGDIAINDDPAKLIANTKLGPMNIRFDATNFNLIGVGYDRGQTISFLTTYNRKSSCNSPIDQILIDYKGNCLPCCNIHTSMQSYENYILGNVLTDDLFSIYANQAYQKWRDGCSQSPPVFDICKTCARGDVQ